jgi:hypothetical protein
MASALEPLLSDALGLKAAEVVSHPGVIITLVPVQKRNWGVDWPTGITGKEGHGEMAIPA